MCFLECVFYLNLFSCAYDNLNFFSAYNHDWVLRNNQEILIKINRGWANSWWEQDSANICKNFSKFKTTMKKRDNYFLLNLHLDSETVCKQLGPWRSRSLNWPWEPDKCSAYVTEACRTALQHRNHYSPAKMHAAGNWLRFLQRVSHCKSHMEHCSSAKFWSNHLLLHLCRRRFRNGFSRILVTALLSSVHTWFICPFIQPSAQIRYLGLQVAIWSLPGTCLTCHTRNKFKCTHFKSEHEFRASKRLGSCGNA